MERKPFSSTFPLFLLLLLLFSGGFFSPLPAQGEIPFKTVGPGYLVVRARLRREGVTMERHLLVDLLCPLPLVYFPSEALFLGIRKKQGAFLDLEAGEVTLKKVPVFLAKVRLLQELTKDYASQLEEIPLAGILGYPALKKFRLEIDPLDQVLRLLPPAPIGDVPREQPGRWVLPLVLEKGPPRVEGSLAGKAQGFLYLATGSPHSFLFAGALAKAGLEGRPVEDLKVGRAQLAGIVPFRSMEVENLLYRLPGPLLGGLGWDFLRSFRVVLDGANRVILFERVRWEPFPKEEQEYVLARARGVEGLREFLKSHESSPFALEAAREVFALLEEEGAGEAELARAGRTWAALAPEGDRAQVYLEVVRTLMEFQPPPPVTADLLKEGIDASRVAREKEAAYRLQHLAGRYFLLRKEYRKARRHLLNAVFGLIHEGPVNLDMGLCWEGLGKPKRAFGAMVRALLDAEKSGPEALKALEKLWDAHFGKGLRTGFLESLAERLEGRIPVFHPPGKAAPPPKGPVHRPLVELFSGSDCDPCAGADLAFEGAADCFPGGAVFLSWHLHIPSPDPLTVPEGLGRARRLGVEGTPTLFVDGELVLKGGGGVGEARRLFEKIRAALEKARRKKPRWVLSGRARVDREGKACSGEIRVQGPPCRVQVWLAAGRLVYPGRNGIVLHRFVARAGLLPPAGAAPDGKGRVPFRADLPSLWKRIRDGLDQVELQLQEKDFHFRWKPDKPDPAELVVLAVVFPPGTSTPAESLLILPEGPGKAAGKGSQKTAGAGARKRAGLPGRLGGMVILPGRLIQAGRILRLPRGKKKGGGGH